MGAYPQPLAELVVGEGMLGSLAVLLGYWGGKSEYNFNVLEKLEIPPQLISLVVFSALLLSNFTTCSASFYEERLAKEVNTLFSVPLPAIPFFFLLHIGIYSHFKTLLTALLCFLCL